MDNIISMTDAGKLYSWILKNQDTGKSTTREVRHERVEKLGMKAEDYKTWIKLAVNSSSFCCNGQYTATLIGRQKNGSEFTPFFSENGEVDTHSYVFCYAE